MRHQRRAAYALVPLTLEAAQEHFADLISAEGFRSCARRRHAFLIARRKAIELSQSPMHPAIVGNHHSRTQARVLRKCEAA